MKVIVRRGLVLAGLLGLLALVLVGAALRSPSSYVADPPSSPAADASAPVAPARLADPPSASPTPSPQATTLRAVGLGDSVMSGTNCGCDGIMDEYAREFARTSGRRVAAQNFGVGGSTTADLLTSLSDDQTVRAAVAGADIVVIVIGANDLHDDLDQWQNGGCSASCYQPDVAAMGQRLAEVLNTVSTLSHGRAEVLVTDYWNVFTDGEVARRNGAAELRFHVAVTSAANREITARAAEAGDRLVDLVGPFKGSEDGDPSALLATDGDHPNAAGVRVIAAALVAAT